MGEIRIVGPGKTRGYPYPVCKKIVSAEHDMGPAQSYRAGLSNSEKFESPGVFNHCIVRLNKNDVIVTLKFAKFQPV